LNFFKTNTTKLILSYLIYYFSIFFIMDILVLFMEKVTLSIGFGETISTISFLDDIINIKQYIFPFFEINIIKEHILTPLYYSFYLMNAVVIYYILIFGIFFKFNVKKSVKYFKLKIFYLSKYIFKGKNIKTFSFKDMFILWSIFSLLTNSLIFSIISIFLVSVFYCFDYYSLNYLILIYIGLNLYIIYIALKKYKNEFRLILLELLLFFLPKREQLYIYDINNYYGECYIAIGKFNYEIFNKLILKKNTLELELKLLSEEKSFFLIDEDEHSVAINNTSYKQYLNLKAQLTDTLFRINKIYQRNKALQTIS